MRNSLVNKITFVFLLLIFISFLILIFIILYQSRNLEIADGYNVLIENVIYSFAIMAIVIMIVMLIVGRVLVVAISKPLERLILEIEKIARGQYGEEIVIKTNDEIEALSHSFNHMTKKIQGYTSELKSQRDALETIFESIPGKLLIIDTSYNISMRNKEGGCFYNQNLVGFYENDGIGAEDSIKCYTFYRREHFPCAGCPVERTKINKKSEFAEIVYNSEVYQFRTSPLFFQNSNEEIDKIIVYCVNVTDQVIMEKEVLQMDKLVFMGQLATGITHELKNPLSTLKTGTYYLSKLSEKKDIPRYILNREIKTTLINLNENLERAENSVRNILEFAKPTDLKKEPIIIDKIVQQVLMLFTNELVKCKVKVQLDVKTNEYIGDYDSNVIKNILIHLISNAMQAMPSGGELKIGVNKEEQGYIKVYVADTGIGIKKEDLNKVFEPFYTTKEREGTGMGLWIVKKQIERFNGSIEISSTIGEGTIFYIKFPDFEGDLL